MARVLLDSPVPHLDREFDYLVPVALDESARVGSRVTVRFSGREMTGWITQRRAEPTTAAALSDLQAVLTRVPPLTAEVLELARAVAARQAGVVTDVLRSAVPPRVVAVEKEILAEPGADHPASQRHDEQNADPVADGAEAHAVTEDDVLDALEGGQAFLSAVCAGDAPRAAASLPSRTGLWDEERVLAGVARRAADAGRGVVLVVPDQRDLDRLCAVLDDLLGEHAYARLTGEDGHTPRYRAHLRLLTGRCRIAVGTRSAIWAPVPDLGLIVVWDDGDDSYADPRAPYPHVRDVAVQRCHHAHSALLFASTSRTTAVQRLVELGWLQSLEAPRHRVREATPRIIATADSWESARDPFARRARLPHAAWQVARHALSGPCPGPVLVQVARAGFIPALVCERCRTPARCRHCAGPLAFRDRAAAERGELACRWCGTRERDIECPECGWRRLRAGARGVDRTADELGRAFPQVPVVSSSAAHRVGTVEDRPALVVATVGAEPVAQNGYAAALLLDGDAQLTREGLDVPARVLARWFAAAALVRPADRGGVAVVTAEHAETVGALTRWDPAGFASRQLAERRELHLPPAGRIAEVTGPDRAVAQYLALVEEARREGAAGSVLSAGPLPWIGPVPLPEDEQRHRALLLFPYTASEATAALLRSGRSAASARGEAEGVRIRLDPIGVL